MKFKLFLCLGFLSFFVSCALKSEFDGVQQKQELLESRIIALEESNLGSVKDLQEFTKNQISQFREVQLNFLDDVELIKKEIALISAKSEEVDYLSRKLNEQVVQLKKRLGDQVIALSELKRVFSIKKPVSKDIKNKKERTAYERGLNYLQERDLDAAYKQFKSFRTEYSRSSFYDDALFYIGYIQLLQGRFENATLHFYELKEQFPKSSKRSEGLWWLGVSLEKTGDKQAAIDIYTTMLKFKKANEFRQKAEIRLDEIQPQPTKKKKKKSPKK